MTFVPGPYQRQSKSPIQLDVVLAVEGRDAFEFVLALMTQLGLQNQIEVRDAGGVALKPKGDFEQYLKVLPNIAGFDKVASLGIMRDCEADPTQAFQNTCTALSQAGLSVPLAALQPTQSTPKVIVMLLPDPQSPGMLETLCWRSLAGSAIVSCIDDYLDCVHKQTGRTVKYPDKSRVYSYIAAQEEPWFLLGLAARSNYFPWTSPAFDQLKGFLQDLVKKTP